MEPSFYGVVATLLGGIGVALKFLAGELKHHQALVEVDLAECRDDRKILHNKLNDHSTQLAKLQGYYEGVNAESGSPINTTRPTNDSSL